MNGGFGRTVWLWGSVVGMQVWHVSQPPMRGRSWDEVVIYTLRWSQELTNTPNNDSRLFQVLFVDYGNVAEVPVSDIYRIDDRSLMEVPPQAIFVQIQGVTASVLSRRHFTEAVINRTVGIQLCKWLSLVTISLSIWDIHLVIDFDASSVWSTAVFTMLVQFGSVVAIVFNIAFAACFRVNQT